MKKIILVITVICAVGALNAQEISPKVKQKVDQKIAKWAVQIDASEEQKNAISSVMIKYESLILSKQKDLSKDRTNLTEVETSIKAYKENMQKEVEALLTADQLEKLNGIKAKGVEKQISK
ncbi:hypothetical protein OAW23_06720 [Flavobacteriales bacterium]|jgi:hypothetical protein|nr:hypothetical protein [Flavobacteriales bacterium]